MENNDMETVYEMYFAEFLRDRRKKMGITQNELGQMVHVSKSAITKWETGRGIPDRTNLRQLSKILGISMDDMIKVCEGEKPALEYEFIVKDLIALLERYGYRVIKENTEG